MDFASITRQGEKDYNSDAQVAFELDGNYLFSVADGHETPTAADAVIQSVTDDFNKSEAISKASISQFFQNASDKLCETDEPASSCLSLLMTDGSVALWGNVGDCRVYLLRDNWLYEISPDDSGAYAMYEAEKIRYPKIRKRKERYTLLNLLGKTYNGKPHISNPEKLKSGDSFLICSDGFWENIHERQVEKTLKKSKSAQEWLDKMMLIAEKNVHQKKYTRFRDSLSAITVII